MRHMTYTRFVSAAALALSVAIPLGADRQDPASLQAADAPPNAVWIDSLDLSKAPIRRPRAQRGQAAAPPLVFRLAGATYAHGLPLQSDGDITIDLGGAATRFVAMIGVDDGSPATPATALPAPVT